MIFTNAYARTIDSKGRLQIPTQFRVLIESARYSGVLYLAPGARPRTLNLYLEEDFHEMAASMDHQFLPDDDALTFQDLFYSMAVRLDVDKQGRVILPEASVKRAGLDSEVVLTGAGRHLVLWDKQAYGEFVDQHWEKWQQVRRQARAASRKTNRSEDGQ
jgi:MraZ protein